MSYDEFGVDLNSTDAVTIDRLEAQRIEMKADHDRLQDRINALTSELDRASDENARLQRDLFYMYNTVNHVLEHEPEEKTLCSAIRMLINRYGENSAHLENIRNINAMLVGQISRLVYAFNPESKELDPVDPNKNLEAVVSEVIDKAIRAFTEAQIGYELTGQVTTLNRDNKALMSAVKDNEQYQTDIRKGIVDSGLLEDPSKLDGLYLDDAVEELIKTTRRWISGRDEWMREASRNANEAARAEQGRAALEVDAKNLRQINRCLAMTLVDIDHLLEDIGFHGERVTEEHLSANAQRIFFDAVEAMTELKELRTKVESLRNLKIEPVPMVGAAWDALRHAGVNTNNHTTLADAIGWLGQRYGDVCREANRLIMESETRNEFVNGVLTVHTEGTTVIIVDHSA